MRLLAQAGVGTAVLQARKRHPAGEALLLLPMTTHNGVLAKMLEVLVP
jgi:hypothetical protein